LFEGQIANINYGMQVLISSQITHQKINSFNSLNPYDLDR
jgi:hypothetical protein